MKNNKLGIGVIGCGTFCDAYIDTLKTSYANVEVISCSDLDMTKAEETAGK